MDDDTTIYYCRSCGWRNEPIYRGVMKPECPICLGSLHFITYKRGREEAAALALLANALE